MDEIAQKFELWFCDLYPKMKSYLRKRFLLDGNIDDIAQEVALAAYVHMKDHGFSAQEEFNSWCLLRAKWTTLNRLRDTAKAAVPKEGHMAIRAHEKLRSMPVVADDDVLTVEQHEIFEVIRRLPPRQRMSILYSIRGYSNAEIAGMLSVEESTVRSLLRHARDRIAAELPGH